MSEKSTPSTRFDGFTNDSELRQASHNVPPVRFTADDGSDFPAWEEKKLGDLCSYVHKRGQAGNYVGTENLLQNFGGIRQLGADQKKEGILYSKGDILFSNIRPYLKKTWLADRSGTCSSDVLVFRSTTVLPGYLYSLIASDRFIGEVMGSAKGSKMPRGDKQAILQIASAVPSLPEQKKIAACLSSVDEALTLCRRKLDLLTQAKKALIQQIFSQKLRFKADDGSDFPAWEEKKLGRLCESIASGKTKKSTEGQIPLWGSSGLLGHTKEAEFKGDYLLVGRVGAAGRVRHYVGDFSASDNTLVIKPMIQKISSVWLTGYLEYFNLNRLAFGSSQPLITATQLKRLSVITPKLQEQKKIAACLSSADALIDQARIELEQWQDVKKSLLQQLFV